MSNFEFLKTELERAEEAEAQCVELMRKLPGMIERAAEPGSGVDAAGLARLAAINLTLHERLVKQTVQARSALRRAEQQQ